MVEIHHLVLEEHEIEHDEKTILTEIFGIAPYSYWSSFYISTSKKLPIGTGIQSVVWKELKESECLYILKVTTFSNFWIFVLEMFPMDGKNHGVVTDQFFTSRKWYFPMVIETKFSNREGNFDGFAIEQSFSKWKAVDWGDERRDTAGSSGRLWNWTTKKNKCDESLPAPNHLNY